MARHCCNRFIQKIHADDIRVDDYGKAKQFSLFSIGRPHMRAFHCSWFCFFLAFTAWFGIQPLLPTIMRELHLSKKDVANSGIASVAATILVRISVGPLCDKFGPRRVMSALLMSGSIPMALAGLIKNGTGLIIIRLFIGCLGGTFVPCQFWTSVMFNYKIVGTANALVGGWGNLGGGFTFLFMPAIFQLMKTCGAHEFLAWKLAVVIPALLCCLTGISILFTSDDCPQGEWRKRRHEHEKPKELSKILNEEEILNLKTASTVDDNRQPKIWTILTVILLIIQYGMCFGVEIAADTVLNLYFLFKFKKEDCNDTLISLLNENSTIRTSITDDSDFHCSILDQNSASMLASIFGLMNLFARALGGTFSDIFFKHFRLPGRLLAHMICLVGEGLMLIIFSQMTSISTAIVALVFWSVFVQGSEGTTYSIVPYVHGRRVGVIAGFVGAGGNTGAIIWNTLWGQLIEYDPSSWFWILGTIIICGSMLTLIIRVEGKMIWHIFVKSDSNTGQVNDNNERENIVSEI